MEEENRNVSLETRYKEALRKAKEVREYVAKENNGCEPSIAECLAYDMQYVDKYVENLLKERQEDKDRIKELDEYKKIAELTKISCCTAQNCEALNNAIKEGLENQKLKVELDKKDRIIDLMAEDLNCFRDESDMLRGIKEDCFIPREYSDIDDCVKKISCKQCIIEYFTKKAEGN